MTSPTVRSRTRLPERVVGDRRSGRGRPGWRAVHWTTSISDQCAPRTCSPSRFSTRACLAYTWASGTKSSGANLGRSRKVAPVELRRAPRCRRAPAARASRRPSPVLHGFARRTRLRASGVMCSRTSSASPWKPPVARIDRHAVGELGQRLAEPHVACATGESLASAPRVEANTRREWIARSPA